MTELKFSAPPYETVDVIRDLRREIERPQPQLPAAATPVRQRGIRRLMRSAEKRFRRLWRRVYRSRSEHHEG